MLSLSVPDSTGKSKVMYVKTSNVESCDHLDIVQLGQNTVYPFLAPRPRLASRMINASVIQDVSAFLVNHISALSEENGRILLPEILVAKLVCYVKRTDDDAEGPMQLRKLICRFPEESVQASTDIWPKGTYDQIVVPFVLNRFVGCDSFVAIMRSLQKGAKRKSGAVNVFERHQKFDDHSESDLKLVILNYQDELAQKNEELKRVRNNRDYWKKRSEDLGAMVEHTDKQLEEVRQKVCFRPGRHISNCGGYSLAARRNYGHTAATTASIMVTSDLGDSGVVRDSKQCHSVRAQDGGGEDFAFSDVLRFSS